MKSKGKTVYKFDLNGVFIEEYPNGLTQAAKANKLPTCNVASGLYGGHCVHGLYYFSFDRRFVRTKERQSTKSYLALTVSDNVEVEPYIIYPKPITPDPMPEDLDLVVGDFKPRKMNYER